MNTLEKIMTVLQWAFVAVYLVMFVVFKTEIPTATNYLIGVIFLLNGAVCLRTKKNLSPIYFILGAVNIVFITLNLLIS